MQKSVTWHMTLKDKQEVIWNLLTAQRSAHFSSTDFRVLVVAARLVCHLPYII